MILDFFQFSKKVEKSMPKGTSKIMFFCPKMVPGRPRVDLYGDFRGFGRRLIFDEFLDRQKVGQIRKKYTFWRPKASRMIELGRPGGMSGGAGGEIMRGGEGIMIRILHEFERCKNLARIMPRVRHASSPAEAGGGGFN